MEFWIEQATLWIMEPNCWPATAKAHQLPCTGWVKPGDSETHQVLIAMPSNSSVRGPLLKAPCSLGWHLSPWITWCMKLTSLINIPYCRPSAWTFAASVITFFWKLSWDNSVETKFIWKWGMEAIWSCKRKGDMKSNLSKWENSWLRVFSGVLSSQGELC